MGSVSGRQQLFAFMASAVVLGAVAVAAASFGVSLPFMTRDYSALAEVHPLSGVLSNLGILVWCATAAVCLFAAAVLRASGQSQMSRFFAASGALTGYLTLDDFFLIHEDLAKRYLGWDETIVFAILGVVVLVYLYSFRKVIWHSSFIVLAIAVVLLAASVMTEVIFEPVMWLLRDWQYLLEDGFKWMGIAAWSCYYVCTARGAVAGVPQPSGDPA